MTPRESSVEKSMRPGKNSNYIILPPSMVEVFSGCNTTIFGQGKANLEYKI